MRGEWVTLTIIALVVILGAFVLAFAIWALS
jgi:hypothetical protein